MKKVIAAIVMAAGLAAGAADVTVITDVQDTTATDLALYEQDEGTVGVYFERDGDEHSVSGDAVLWYGTNKLQSASVHSITQTISSATNYFEFDIGTDDFPVESPPRNYWTYGVEVDGKMQGDGRLYVKNRPGVTNGTLDLAGSTNINWSQIEEFNGVDDAPVIAGTGITATTGATGRVTFSTTGLTQELGDARYVNTGEVDSVTGDMILPDAAFTTLVQNAQAPSTDDQTLAEVLGEGSSASNQPITDLSYVDPVTTNEAPAHQEGRWYWDTEHGCLAYMTSVSGSDVQVGQELGYPVRNTTGSTISNGTFVVLEDKGTGHIPDVLVAANTNEALSCVFGMVTSDIADNGFGRVVWAGAGHDMDTAGLTESDKIYLATVGTGVNGYNWTTNKPTSGYVVVLGKVQNAHVTQGIVNVSIHPPITVSDVYGLGTAAESNATDFATAAQGVLAENATQPDEVNNWTASQSITTCQWEFEDNSSILMADDDYDPAFVAYIKYHWLGVTAIDRGIIFDIEVDNNTNTLKYIFQGSHEVSANLGSGTNLPLSGLAQSGATADQVATWNGSAWAPADASGGSSGGGGFPVTLDEWYDMELQDPSAAPHRAWSDGGGNVVYGRELESTNTYNLFFDFRVATGAAVTVTSPLVWETGTNQTASVICDVKYAYDDTLQVSLTNTTAALPTIANATRNESTIVNAWTNNIGTGHFRFWFDKGDSAVANGTLGFVGAPTITITEQ